MARGAGLFDQLASNGLFTPVIVMTALMDERIPDQVRAPGPNAVLLPKPFELDELEAAVAKLIPAPPTAGRPS